MNYGFGGELYYKSRSKHTTSTFSITFLNRVLLLIIHNYAITSLVLFIVTLHNTAIQLPKTGSLN